MQKKADSFLMSINSKTYRIVLFITMLWLCMKSIIFFAFTAIYLTMELFTGVSPALLIVIFIIPIAYIGIKGVTTLARCCEILMPIIFVIIIMNFAFLDTYMDFDRIFPFLSLPPSEFITNSFRFGPWIGDALPIMFLKMEKKKFPYVGINTFMVLVIINITALIGIAMYGEALPSVANLLIRISSFNQLSLQIGRMEWTSLFVVLTMCIMTLAYFFWGATACCERIFNTKKPMQILFPIILITVILAAPSIKTISELSISDFGIAMFGFAMGLPVIILAIYLIAKRKYRKQSDAKMPPLAETNTEVSLSTADNQADSAASGGVAPEGKQFPMSDTDPAATPQNIDAANTEEIA